AGSWHACALKDDGTVWCWGQNLDGALGIGQDPQSFDANNYQNPSEWQKLLSPYAVQVVAGVSTSGGAADTSTPLQDVVQIAAGSSDHTCALIDPDGDGQGSVRCWAWNGGAEGELGNGDTGTTYALLPQPPVTDGTGQVLADVTQIAAGGDHTCALRIDGTVWCWGWNQYGQVGDGSNNDAPTARRVVVDATGTALTGVQAVVSERGSHSCALKQDGTVWCWGDNRKGQLGDGSTTSRNVAVPVQGLPDPAQDPVVALAAGGGGRDPTVLSRLPNDPNALEQYEGGHTCALTQSGKVYCWGSNDRGQLGDGSTTDRTSPVPVSGL
ncbi:MAG: hypothetical protein D6809_01080, partial [Gammaproteobacteria bacterium]